MISKYTYPISSTIIMLLTALLVLLGSLLPSQATAQGDAWRTYPKISAINGLVAHGNDIWAATDGGVLRWQRNEGNYIRYATSEGLVDNQANAIAVDEAGQVWVGTNAGVSLFDGQRWTTYTTAEGLVDNEVRAIAVNDETGQVWIGTAAGVSRFDGQTWQSYTTAEGLVDNEVRAIAVNDETGQVWIGTAAGVSLFEGQTWQSYTTAEGLASDDVRAIALGREGQLWIGTGEGASLLNGQEWTTYTTEDDLVDNEVWAIAIDDAGHPWFATSGGVSEFGEGLRAVYTAEDGYALQDSMVRAIAIDAAGHKWVGTVDGSLSEFDGRRWTIRAPLGQVTAIASDDAGQVWFGTPGSGVTHFDGQTWTPYTRVDGLASNWVTGIAIDPAGHVWLATQAGVSRYNGREWVTFTSDMGLATDDVRAIAIDKEGRYWFATVGGNRWWNGSLSMFDGQTWTKYSSANGLASDNILSLAIDGQDRVWAGTEAGLSVFDGRGWLSYTRDNGLAHNWVYSLAVDPAGRVWAGTGGGVSMFDGDTWTTYTVLDGLASNVIYTLAIDAKGQVWAGTGGGLSYFDGRQWTSFTPAEGLPYSQVQAIAFAQTGANSGQLLWLGFGEIESGVTLFDEAHWQAPPATTPAVTAEPVAPALAASIEVTGARLIDTAAGRVYARGLVDGITRTLVMALADGQVLATYDLAGELALDTARQRLYIDQGEAGLAVLNTGAERLETLIRLPASRSAPPAPQVDPATGQVLAFRDNIVYRVEPETGEIRATLSTEFTEVRFCNDPRLELSPIRAGRYDSTHRLLYTQFQSYYPCREEPARYTLVAYDLTSGEAAGQREGDLMKAAVFDGYLYYPVLQSGEAASSRETWQEQAPWLSSRWDGYWSDSPGRYSNNSSAAAAKTPAGRLIAWQEGEPWLEVSGWSEAGDTLYVDPQRQRLYQTTQAGYLRVFDARSLALLMSLPSPVTGELAGYAPETDELYFLVEGQLQAWPAEAIQPLAPEPLAASPAPSTPMRALIVSPNWSQDQTLFGLWPDSPLYISQDGGQSWNQSGAKLPGPVSALAVSPDYGRDQTLLVGVTGNGIFRSTDGGQSWQPSGAGLAHMEINEILLSPGFVQDQTAFAATAASLYRSTDGGQSWQKLISPVSRVVLSPGFTQDQTLLGWGYNTRLYRSLDGGDSWAFIQMLPQGIQRLSPAPSFPLSRLLFAYGLGHNQGSLYRSTDGGYSDRVALRGKFTIEQLLHAGLNQPIFLLASIRAKSMSSPVIQRVVYRSTDGGLTWAIADLPAGVVPVTLAISPNFAQDQTLFIGTTGGQVVRWGGAQ